MHSSHRESLLTSRAGVCRLVPSGAVPMLASRPLGVAGQGATGTAPPQERRLLHRCGRYARRQQASERPSAGSALRTIPARPPSRATTWPRSRRHDGTPHRTLTSDLGPAVQLHQVPLGTAAVPRAMTEMMPEPVREHLHPALGTAAGDHLVDPAGSQRPRSFTPSHHCSRCAWACLARTRMYRSRVRALS